MLSLVEASHPQGNGAAASANGDVCDKEKELVRALAAVMDCPSPDDPDSPLAEFSANTESIKS